MNIADWILARLAARPYGPAQSSEALRVRYPVWCQACCCRWHPEMLTGYCLSETTCARCGRLSECAIVHDPDAPVPICRRCDRPLYYAGQIECHHCGAVQHPSPTLKEKSP